METNKERYTEDFILSEWHRILHSQEPNKIEAIKK